MQLNFVFVMHALLAAIFGLALLLVPQFLMQLLGVPTIDITDIARNLARLTGMYHIGVAILTTLGMNSPSQYARRTVVITMFLSQVLQIAIAIAYAVQTIIGMVGK